MYKPIIRILASLHLLLPNGNRRATCHLLIRARGTSGEVASGGYIKSFGSQSKAHRCHAYP